MSDLCKQRKTTQQGSLASGEGRIESNRLMIGVGGTVGREQPSLGLVRMELTLKRHVCEVEQMVKKGSWGTSQDEHAYYCA